jgi:hypothetical protein
MHHVHERAQECCYLELQAFSILPCLQQRLLAQAPPKKRMSYLPQRIQTNAQCFLQLINLKMKKL